MPGHDGAEGQYTISILDFSCNCCRLYLSSLLKLKSILLIKIIGFYWILWVFNAFIIHFWFLHPDTTDLFYENRRKLYNQE